MKRISLMLAVALATATMYSCNDSGTKDGDTTTADTAKTVDAVEAAKDTNDKKEDNKTIAVNEDDSKFLVFAADAGMTEIQAAQLAKSQTVSDKTKAFADEMIKDHTAAGDEVKALAATKNVTLPSAISDDHQKAIKDLTDKKPADFEKAYINMMVDDHQKVVDKFKDASDKCKDPDVKALAAKLLPKLQGHLDHAKMLKDGLKKS
jgi:putative membrane protein